MMGVEVMTDFPRNISGQNKLVNELLDGIPQMVIQKLKTACSEEFPNAVCSIRIIRFKKGRSKKYVKFVSEPMGDKGVCELAGIGKVLTKKLEAKGFGKAYVLLGEYLRMEKQETLFIDWMRYISGANKRQAFDCYLCLHDWCRVFMCCQPLS